MMLHELRVVDVVVVAIDLQNTSRNYDLQREQMQMMIDGDQVKLAVGTVLSL
jgi:hypothetical protein